MTLAEYKIKVNSSTNQKQDRKAGPWARLRLMRGQTWAPYLELQQGWDYHGGGLKNNSPAARHCGLVGSAGPENVKEKRNSLKIRN